MKETGQMQITEQEYAELRAYARAGALVQARRIVTEFPDILGDLTALAKPGGFATTERATTHRGRRRLTAVEKAAISRRMKATWRKRRQGK